MAKTNRDLIIETHTRLDELSKQFANHLGHHWAVTLSCITIALGGIATAIIALLK